MATNRVDVVVGSAEMEGSMQGLHSEATIARPLTTTAVVMSVLAALVAIALVVTIRVKAIARRNDYAELTDAVQFEVDEDAPMTI
jgi:hypothetical protein